MEEKYNKQEEQSNLSFFEPVAADTNANRSIKKIVFIFVLGALAGLISALVANMLAVTISIMFYALSDNGSMYYLVLYGQLIIYTILLYIFSYMVFRKWDHTKMEKVIFLSSYFLLYIIMFVFYIL